MFLADFLGNVFFAGTVVGAVAWVGIMAHIMGYVSIPKREK